MYSVGLARARGKGEREYKDARTPWVQPGAVHLAAEQVAGGDAPLTARQFGVDERLEALDEARLNL